MKVHFRQLTSRGDRGNGIRIQLTIAAASIVVQAAQALTGIPMAIGIWTQATAEHAKDMIDGAIPFQPNRLITPRDGNSPCRKPVGGFAEVGWAACWGHLDSQA